MQNKKNLLFGLALVGCWAVATPSVADDTFVESDDVIIEETDEQASMDNVAADAISNYSADGSLFQQITNLEQEKILMQLEKERAQLDLELDRLAAEKIKLHMEIDTLSGRAEQQQQEIETQKAKLEAEAARIEREKEAWMAETENKTTYRAPTTRDDESAPTVDISKKYRLVNVVGAGNQLQATVEDLSTGQTKRISAGKKLDGFEVKTISVYDGVVFSDSEGNTQTLNVSNGN